MGTLVNILLGIVLSMVAPEEMEQKMDVVFKAETHPCEAGLGKSDAFHTFLENEFYPTKSGTTTYETSMKINFDTRGMNPIIIGVDVPPACLPVPFQAGRTGRSDL